MCRAKPVLMRSELTEQYYIVTSFSKPGVAKNKFNCTEEIKAILKPYQNLIDDLEELVKRNQLAWDNSKDKSQGLLPEVYLANRVMINDLREFEGEVK